IQELICLLWGYPGAAPWLPLVTAFVHGLATYMCSCNRCAICAMGMAYGNPRKSRFRQGLGPRRNDEPDFTNDKLRYGVTILAGSAHWKNISLTPLGMTARGSLLSLPRATERSEVVERA